LKKCLLFAACFALLFALTGCSGYQLENRVLAVCMALDLTEDPHNRLQISVQISTAEGGETEGSYAIISARGKDWFDALGMLRGVSTHILSFTQLRAIVVSEALSQDALFFALLEDIYQMPQMRSNTYVLVAMGDARTFLESSKPDIGVSLSKYIDIVILNTIRQGYAPHSTLGELVRDMGSAGNSGAAPLVMLGAAVKEGDPPHLPPRNPHDLLPDQLVSEGSGNIRLMGAAVTDGKRTVGTLTGYEVQLLMLLRGQAEEILCYAADASVMVRLKKKPRLSICFGAPEVLHVNVFLFGYALPDEISSAEEAAEVICADLEALIKKCQALRADAIGFGQIAIRGFDTIPRWEKYDWISRFVHADVKINVEITPMLGIS